ncbi:MAG TPA: LuxR C-terminal-related transcriptional regulator [Polyangiales bacterium]|nr:LuxR C-terminal-related transcriptional regulator [Polyangiales bacterium]
MRELLRLDGSESMLLQATVDALPLLPGELFSVANRYSISDGRLTPGTLTARGQQKFEKLARAFTMIEDGTPEFLNEDAALTSTTHAESWNDSAARAAEIAECADFVGTVVDLGGGRFAMAGAGTAERMVTPRQDLKTYEAIHQLLTINLRVRDALGGELALEAADAVFETDGQVVELRDDGTQQRGARKRLSELVRAREQQDGFTTLEQADALTHWNELAGGGYVLLDHVDSDQRRYVVAYKLGDPQPRSQTLNARERHVLERILLGARNKSIASELGVSSAHITGISQRALAKIGARSTADLARVMRARSSLVMSELAVGGETLIALGYRDETAHALAGLTAAERQVAKAVLDGQSQRAIALERGVSERTVASQVASIYRKIGVSGRRELTAKLAR